MEDRVANVVLEAGVRCHRRVELGPEGRSLDAAAEVGAEERRVSPVQDSEFVTHGTWPNAL